MKRFDFYILFLTVMCLCCGCIEEVSVEEHIGSDIRIYADFSETRTTHTSADGVTSVEWVAGDKIGICTDEQEHLCYIADESGKSTSFSAESTKLEAQEGDVVYAYYKYNERDFTVYKSFNLPNIQDQCYSEGLAEYDMLYAKGEVHNNEVNLKFRHIFAFLKVTVPTRMLGKYGDSGSYELHLTSDQTISFTEGRYNMQEDKFVTNGYNTINYLIDNDISGKDNVTITIAMLPQANETEVSIYTVSENGVRNRLYIVNSPEDGFRAGYVYNLNLSEQLLNEKEKSVAALTALYNSTNGDKWYRNDNWLSDEPLYKWYGLNHNYWPENTIEVDEIVEIQLFDNNLCGTLPVEFTHIMSKAQDIMIDGNNMYGVIPEEVRTHARWNEFGWNVILQNPYYGGGFDMTDINLRASDMEVEYLKGGTARLADLLKANRISLIMIDTPSDELANLFLSYRNKGFGIIISHSGTGGESREATIERTDKYALTDGIVRLWKMQLQHPQLGEGLRWLGTVFLLDDEGNLIDVLPRDWAIPESWYCSKIGQRLQEHLGDPEEHPEFSTSYYKSTDYSRDGEVVTLQSATVGNGIDLVFMGDGYVDKQMEDGGRYEQDMKASMEYFFEVEPYKSFRNRFNVYAVKVISPNEERAEGCEWRINFNNDICIEYASKVSGIDSDKVTIVNVANNPDPMFVSGYTNMYESGASVAHIEKGGPSSIIVHEAGGHGLGKLLDEYIYSGYEENYCPPENLESFRNWIKTDYHDKGWGMNIDTTDDPEKVIWNHFLKDERYSGEVGIYQGAWYWPTDLWRASENSVMNSDYSRFNAPSRETIYKWIMQWSEGEGWEYDFEDFAKYDQINRGAVATRSNYVERRDNREFIHRPPTVIKGSPANKIEQDDSIEHYLSK